jgi:hypothetical protein
MKSRVTITDDFVTDTVSVHLSGKLINQYDIREVQDAYGMDKMMTDLEEYCKENSIELGEDVELVLIRQ